MDMNERIKSIALEQSQTSRMLSSKTGIPTHVVSAIKNGKHAPSEAVLMKLADVFGVTVDYLEFGDHHPSPSEPLWGEAAAELLIDRLEAERDALQKRLDGIQSRAEARLEILLKSLVLYERKPRQFYLSIPLTKEQIKNISHIITGVDIDKL